MVAHNSSFQCLLNPNTQLFSNENWAKSYLRDTIASVQNKNRVRGVCFTA